MTKTLFQYGFAPLGADVLAVAKYHERITIIRQCKRRSLSTAALGSGGMMSGRLSPYDTENVGVLKERRQC
jgi:hypothetical protein